MITFSKGRQLVQSLKKIFNAFYVVLKATLRTKNTNLPVLRRNTTQNKPYHERLCFKQQWKQRDIKLLKGKLPKGKDPKTGEHNQTLNSMLPTRDTPKAK